MVEHLINGVIFILDKLGYFGTFAGMALESACIPIPSEAILPFGGYLSYYWKIKLSLDDNNGNIRGNCRFNRSILFR